MDKTKVLVALGLALDTGDESALAALSALQARAQALEGEVVALKAAQFDPTKHIALDEYSKVSTQLATLTAQAAKDEHAALLKALLDDGRVLPASQVYWAEQPLASLKAFAAVAQPIAALTSTQTGGVGPAGGAAGTALSAEELAVCTQLGLKPEDFLKQGKGA